MVSVKTDGVCFAWFCCDNSNLAWFGFFRMVSTSACMFSIFSTLEHISTVEQQHDLNSSPSLYAEHLILTHESNSKKTFLLSVSNRLC